MTAAVAALVRTTGWTEHAACVGADPELFAPRGIQHRGEVQLAAVATARRYCARCPVITTCAAEADRDQLQGLWGGTHRHRENGRGDLQITPLIPTAPTSTPGRAAS